MDTYSSKLNERNMNKLRNYFSQFNWVQLKEITYTDVMKDQAINNYNLIINNSNTHHNKDTKLQRVNASRLSWIPRISKQAYRPAWSTGCSAEQGINSARTAPGFASLTLGVMEYLTNNSTNPIYQVQPYVGLQYHRNRNSIQTLIYWSNLI